MTYAAIANQYFSDEQDLAEKIRNHLVNTCGWTSHDLVTDNAADYDVVLRSEGEFPDNNDDLYVRIRGNADTLIVYVYTAWDAGLHTGSNQMNVAATTRLTFAAGATQSGNFWCAANMDYIALVTRTSSGSASNYAMMYAGFLEPIYTPAEDPYPVCLTREILVGGDITGVSDVCCTYPTTGNAAVSALNSKARVTSPFIQATGYQQRSAGQSVVMMPILVSDDTTGTEELRGFLKGVYSSCVNTLLYNEDIVTVGTDDFYSFFRTGASSSEPRSIIIGPPL